MPKQEFKTAQPHALNWQELLDVAMETPGSISNIYNRFYEYSFLNQIFLRLQGASEPVATYRRWQDLGRQVMRGSKAFSIVRPVVIAERDDAGEVRHRTTGFKRVNCLFGFSQTTGDDLVPANPPGWDMSKALRTLDIEQVAYTLLAANAQGYSVDQQFALSPVADVPLRTTFHEIGHIVLGHTVPTAEKPHRGEQEFQAEATAYLVLNELEMLTPEIAAHSRGYIQHWVRSERPNDAAIRKVFVATDTILKAGRVALDSHAVE